MATFFDPPPGVTSFEAGALVRRQCRRALLEVGADFTEDKGLLDSLFVVRNSQMPSVKRVLTAIREWSA